MTTLKQILEPYFEDHEIEDAKKCFREWLQQKQIPPEYGNKDVAYKMCKRQLINKFIKELLRELKWEQ